MSSSIPVAVPVTCARPLAAVGSATQSASGTIEISIFAKVTLSLGRAGEATFVDPEPPGWNWGGVAHEEVSASGPSIVVRGLRPHPGKVLLRRATRTIAELSFAPGAAASSAPLVESTESTESADADEWLVVEGADQPSSRRWCKLPTPKVVASLGTGSKRVTLVRRSILIDATAGVVALVFTGTLATERSSQAPSLRVATETNASSEAAAGPTVASPRAQIESTVEMPDLNLPPIPLPFAKGSGAPAVPAELASTTEVPSLNLPPISLPFPKSHGPVAVPVVAPRPVIISPAIPQQTPAAPPPAPMMHLQATPPNVAPMPVPATPAPAMSAGDPRRTELERRVRSGTSLAGLDLRGAPLDNAALRGAKLSGIDLTGADLRCADLTNADLSRAKLHHTRLDGAKLDGANIARASLEHATFVGASLAGAHARHCMGTGCDFTEAILRGADFRYARLEGAVMTAVMGQELVARDADLTDCDLTNATLERADLRESKLVRAKLLGAKVGGADLRDADLREAKTDAGLLSAKLTGARR